MFSLKLCVSAQEAPITFDLDASIYVIGRHSSCDIVIPNKSISRFHCSLILMGGDKNCKPFYVLKDGRICGDKSSNGTWVNGTKIGTHQLNCFDLISFSSSKEYPNFIFEVSNLFLDSEQQTLAKEYE